MRFWRLAQAVLKLIPLSKFCSPVHRRYRSRFKNKLDGGIAHKTEYEASKFLRLRLISLFVRAFFLLLMKPSCGEKWPHSIATSHTIGAWGTKCRNVSDVRWVFRPVSLEVHEWPIGKSGLTLNWPGEISDEKKSDEKSLRISERGCVKFCKPVRESRSFAQN